MSEEPLYFPDALAFRRWLKKHHAKVQEQWVGFYKRGTGRPSLTWPESVDQALCFGWIDGLRMRVDEHAYKIRFTPRRKGSVWSVVNLERARALLAEGQMAPAGLKAFESRTSEREALYSYEQRKNATLPDAFREKLQAHREAWAYFQSRPPWYRRAATHWVVSAKQEATRLRRLETLIRDSAAGRSIRVLRPGPRGPQ